jgi:hypothetical protein
MTALFLLGGVFVVGLILMMWELWTAPSGFQDESGFHALSSNGRTESESQIAGQHAMRPSPLR